MPTGVYKRTPEMLEKCMKNLQKANKAQTHGENCGCAMCRGKRGEYAGENNPRYKHGNDVGWYKHHKDARSKKTLLSQECERCGEVNDLRIHHKDHVISNNNLSNLEHLCRSCHHKEHPRPKRKAEQRSCEVCDKLNWYYPDRLNKNKHFFCNGKCYNEWKEEIYSKKGRLNLPKNEIKEKYNKGNTSQPKLAKQYGVSSSTIWRILHEKV